MNIKYNERSWAIDVISAINECCRNKDWHFDRGGGEHSLKINKKTLFPDVLLFKNKEVIQGWELKMPDTAINDHELIENAIVKANSIGSAHFILWNVRSAVLYVKEESGSFRLYHSWPIITAISTRSEVDPNRSLWINLLNDILFDLNAFLEEGKIARRTNESIIAIDQVIEVITKNKVNTAAIIFKQAKVDNIFEAQLEDWWLNVKTDYWEMRAYMALAKLVLTDWIFKFIFIHTIKRHFNEAKSIDTITAATTPEECLAILEQISGVCNFWNILSSNFAQALVSDTAWEQLLELHFFLKENIPPTDNNELLQSLLEQATQAGKRKVAGQYTTPKQLAHLLALLTVKDKTKIAWDPCCGTGTIVEQIYKLKEKIELSTPEILNSVWASDKHAFPIQLATLTLTKVDAIGEIVKVFKKDVFEIATADKIVFREPHTGVEIEYSFPKIDYIISNLPFIKSKEVPENIKEATQQWLSTNGQIPLNLSKKSDLFAYLPFQFYPLLAESGRIGLILSNAWLGTDYGKEFIEALLHFYQIDSIGVSGKGKWFNNADVVATLLVATKKNVISKQQQQSPILFYTITQSIADDVGPLGREILLKKTSPRVISRNYTLQEIRKLEGIGLPWSAYFTDLSWLDTLGKKLIKITQYFSLSRGERRGWNALFYPSSNEQIEKKYTKPLLKNLRRTKGLIAVTDSKKVAFCCSLSKEELKKQGHQKALQWIDSFEQQKNNSGKLLTNSLKRPNLHWYEMLANNTAEFAANINYNESLFIAYLKEPAFVDQRMIGLSVKEEYADENKLLFLAALNSTLSLFFIEALGFGRGLGALDLNKTKFQKGFRILPIHQLNQLQKDSVIKAFQPLMARNRLPLRVELQQEDRQFFEKVLMGVFGLEYYLMAINKSLLELYNIRRTVVETVN